jgi:glucokinase
MSLFSGQTWLGIDLGGTHISFIVVDDSLDVKRKLVLPNNDRSVDGILDILRKTVAKIMADFPSLVSIGMGIPGNVDPSTGYARYLPNFQWFDPVPIGPCLYETIGLPVFMRNDGRCHAIAESKLGAGRNSKVFALLTLGTGNVKSYSSNIVVTNIKSNLDAL